MTPDRAPGTSHRRARDPRAIGKTTSERRGRQRRNDPAAIRIVHRDSGTAGATRGVARYPEPGSRPAPAGTIRRRLIDPLGRSNDNGRMSLPPQPAPVDRTIKHLEFIQGVINRLASDSFRMKGWSVVLVAALFVLLAREGRIEFVVVALVPVLAFWGLDGYFLQQERLYRALYDHVRTLENDSIDFSMNVKPFSKSPGCAWLSATFSRTLLVFHGALAVAFCLAVAIS